ncbi:YdeI family protein [Chloroflexota bacterium]
METGETRYFENGRQWREWLTKNHATTDGVWLVHYKKRANKTGISYTDALEEALCFGWIDGKMRSIDGEKHMIRYSPRKAKSVWSLLNRERALRLIESGKMSDAGIARIEEAKRNGF